MNKMPNQDPHAQSHCAFHKTFTKHLFVEHAEDSNCGLRFDMHLKCTSMKIQAEPAKLAKCKEIIDSLCLK